MNLLKKSKCVACGLMTCLLISANTPIMYALNYNKFENINIEMPSVIAIDENSGDVLYSQEETKQRPIASLSKTMTLLLILDAIGRGDLDVNEVIELDKDPDAWGSSFYLKKGDKYTIKDYLQMIMIVSANDACVVMAEKIAGSVDSFVKLMNKRAKELGLTDTVFYNPNGLPLSRENDADPGNLSTAKDLATLVKYIMNVYGEDVLKLVSSERINIEGSDDIRYNSNKLLLRQNTFNGYSVDGFKTGYTDKAGFCLIITSNHDNGTPDDKSDDYRVISVSLGGKNSERRFTEHTRLLDYVQSSYTNTKIASKGDKIDTVDEFKSDKYKVGIVPQKDVYALIRKDSKVSSFESSVELNKDISYPVHKGDSMGVLTLTNKSNPELKYSVGLVSDNSTEEISFFDKIFKHIK